MKLVNLLSAAGLLTAPLVPPSSSSAWPSPGSPPWPPPKQGSALGMGPDSGGKLLVNARVAGVAAVSIPASASQI
jgi:hypothetical protein